jgi:hypothetical protein
MRFAQTQVCPLLRNFDTIAPCDGRVEVGVVEDDEGRVAAQLHGALHHLVGGLPEQDAPDLRAPVKVSLRTLGFSQNSFPASELEVVVTTENTPGGTPASSASSPWRARERRQRRGARDEGCTPRRAPAPPCARSWRWESSRA